MSIVVLVLVEAVLLLFVVRFRSRPDIPADAEGPDESARRSMHQGDLTRKNLRFGAALFGLTSLLVAGSVIVAFAYNALD